MPTGLSGRMAASASSSMASHTCLWKGTSFSNAKRRRMPAGMRRAICAASISTVPLPQQGSYSGWGSSPCGSQPVAAIMAAARVSLSGASPLSSRQPRLNSASPEVSM